MYKGILTPNENGGFNAELHKVKSGPEILIEVFMAAGIAAVSYLTQIGLQTAYEKLSSKKEEQKEAKNNASK